VRQPAGVAQLLVDAEMHLDETGPPIGDPVTDRSVETLEAVRREGAGVGRTLDG
jgi:hypothetical protein